MHTPDDPLIPAQDMERGYSSEIVQSVWETAQVVPGNDPQVWRRDESGAWIHRLAYRNRRSEFGWEIADMGTVEAARVIERSGNLGG